MNWPATRLLAFAALLAPASLWAQANVTVQNVTYPSGSTQVDATTSITASTNVVVPNGATVLYTAGSMIDLQPGFQVQAGGTFTARAATPQTVSISAAAATVAVGQTVTFSAGGGGNGYVWSGGSGSLSGSQPSWTPQAPGSYAVSVYSPGGDGWAQSNTASVTITVIQATPVLQSGSFPSVTISSTTALTGGMLGALFVNPYTSNAPTPTGTVTYSASGVGTISVGSKLSEGIYTVTASYPGDSNYTAATATATFTVMGYLATNTYNYNGAGTVTYAAPGSTNYVQIKAWGAGGGQGVSAPGGGGGFAMAGAMLNAGQTLNVVVGGAGSGYQTGGSPGGGTASGLGGAGAGGYSRVWNGGSVDVWAGGGGGGGNSWSAWGGGGGGPSGQTGYGPGAYGGGGGTQSSAGGGGSGDTANGSAGSQGSGGNSNGGSNYIGGGGGGGYYGGGGGGTGDNGSGGGGGGSSNVVTNTTVQAYGAAFEYTPGGTSDPEYPGNNIGYGNFSGTYGSGYNGAVVIDSYQLPLVPSFSNVPSSSNPQVFGNLQQVSYQVQATGAPAVTGYAVASGSSLPPGLTLNTSTGVITGSCSTAATGNQYYSTQITATNSVGSTTVAYYWEIAAPVIDCPVGSFSNPSPLTGGSDSFSFTVSSNFGISAYGGTLWPPPGSANPNPLQIFPLTYVNGAPSSSGQFTFTLPNQPGVYSIQFRVADIYQNFHDFWFICQVGAETDPLPYSTSFETSGSPSWGLGQLQVENGWMCWQGGAYVVAGSSGYPVQAGADSLQVLGSSQYASIDGGSPISVELVKEFNTNGGSYTGAYLDVYAMPVATAAVLNSSIIDNTDSQIGFQMVNANVATVMVFNGNGTGGGTGGTNGWIDTGIHFAIDSTGKSTSWLRITSYHNYSNHTWSLWVNGAYYGPGSETPQAFGMINNTASSLTQVEWIGSGNTSYMDNVNIGTANPFPTPAAPVISSVTSPGAGQVTVSWAAPPDPYGIGYYQVQFAAGSGAYQSAGTTSGTSLTISNMTVGTAYSFQVQAENLSGNWSAWSATYTATLASVQLNSVPTLSFTYNGSDQGPNLNASNFTVSPASAGVSLTGTTSATNAGSYSITATPTGPGIIGQPLVVNWRIYPAVPSIALSPTSASVAAGGSVSFTASGSAGGGYTWSVSPPGPTGVNGSAATQTITFPQVNLSGTPPKPSPYTVSVYSNPTTNYTQSPTVSATVNVTAPTNTDTTNSTVQLNLHAPAN